jgi:hypothetical protein
VSGQIGLQRAHLSLERVNFGLQRLEVRATGQTDNSGSGSQLHKNCLIH